MKASYVDLYSEASEKQGEYWKLYNKHNRTLYEVRVPDVIEFFDGL